MVRRVVIARTPDQAGVTLRIGDTVLGHVANLAGESGQEMTGRFTNTPAFADHADHFARLAKAQAEHDEVVAAALADEVEALGIHLHHSVHDMRIDRPGSLAIKGGIVRFLPNDSFLILRSGGLG